MLLREGKAVALKPKVFDTLLALVRNSGRVMHKDELMRQVWPDTVVEEVNLAHNILIPISDVNNGKAKFFDYTASNKTSVRFFVIKSSDGVYRAALDACDVCYAAKKGYYQDGPPVVPPLHARRGAVRFKSRR
jgi:hypothetical protein